MKLINLPNGDVVRASAIISIEAHRTETIKERTYPPRVVVHYVCGGNSRMNVSPAKDNLEAECLRDGLIADWLMSEEKPKAEKLEVFEQPDTSAATDQTEHDKPWARGRKAS